MKKLINDPTTVVTDALAGIAAAHPELRIDHERKVIYPSRLTRRRQGRSHLRRRLRTRAAPRRLRRRRHARRRLRR